jgi:chorismate dehydratase
MSNKVKLRVGRIDYINIWPVFESIKDDPVVNDIEFTPGHPSLLNNGLADGTIDVSPSSSFEYLVRAEKYRLLPNLGISAETEVRSVLFCLPFSFDELEAYVSKGGKVRLTSASAASVGLLRVLWHFYWKLPSPDWSGVDPGKSLGSGEPFLEIGDYALKTYLNPSPELRIIDLASEWKKFTGLPFVFALWIMNREIDERKRVILERLCHALHKATRDLSGKIHDLAASYPGTSFRTDMIVQYWEKINFNLGPDHLAGLAAFGKYLTELEMIKAMPVLDFYSGTGDAGICR